MKLGRQIASSSATLSVAVLATLAGGSSAARGQYAPGFTFDLRVHGTGAKDITVYEPGETISLDLFVHVQGFDSNPGNDGFNNVAGRFRSSTGGLLGDLIGLPSPAPFNLIGSQTGVQTDVDADGDLDVGDGATPGDPSHYFARGGGESIVGTDFLVGRAQFTAFSLSAGSTDLRFILFPGNLAVLGRLDGDATGLSGVDPLIHYDEPITVHAGQIIGGGTTEYLSGVINDHITLDHTIKPTPGSTLILNQGLSVLPGGLFDSRDGVGNYGPHEIRINDTTSGNAGGAIFVNTMTIGAASPGQFDHTRGLTKIAGQLTLGGASGAPGTLTVAGGSVLATGATIGQAADGLVSQTGGQVTIGTLSMLGASGVASSYHLSGGALTVSSRTDIGGAGPAQFTQSAGESSFNGTLWLAANGSNAGAIQLTGGQMSVNQARITAGTTVDHNGGTFAASLFSVGRPTTGSTAPAVYNFSGGTMSLGSGFIGDQGPGSLVQTDGYVRAAGIIQLFDHYDLSGGSLNAWGLVIWNPANGLAGLFEQSGGGVTADYLDVHGTYHITGGTFTVNKQLRIFDGGTIDFGGGNGALVAGTNTTFDVPTVDFGHSSNASLIGQVDSLINYPAGYVLTDHFGHVSTDGLLHEDGTALHIPAGRRVGGVGTIRGDVTNDGGITPGYRGDVMNIEGSYSQSSIAEMLIEIGGSSEDQTTFDVLHVSGNVTLGGLLDIQLLNGYLPSPDDFYTILTGASVTGVFSNAAGSVTFDGGRFDVTYGGNYVLLSNFQVVPEPAAATMTILTATTALRRRRQSR